MSERVSKNVSVANHQSKLYLHTIASDPVDEVIAPTQSSSRTSLSDGLVVSASSPCTEFAVYVYIDVTVSAVVGGKSKGDAAPAVDASPRASMWEARPCAI